MRDFGSLLAELEDGEVEKLVLTQRNRMRAVVVSVDRWSEMEQALAGGDEAPTNTLNPESGSPAV
jgi:PHD/YefM family antitoxin component YafN of YafNO toxin-antitoxin module